MKKNRRTGSVVLLILLAAMSLLIFGGQLKAVSPSRLVPVSQFRLKSSQRTIIILNI